MESKAAAESTTSGNDSRHARQADGDDDGGEAGGEDAGSRRPQTEGGRDARRATRRRGGRVRETARWNKSMIKRCLTKKSVPNIGFETSAKVNT